MDLKELNLKFNRIVYILNNVFVNVDSYSITSTSVDEANNQLNVFVKYEASDENGTFIDLTVISIPDWVLDRETSNEDIEKNYIKYEKFEIDKNLNQIEYGN